jgi:hypothetical protein
MDYAGHYAEQARYCAYLLRRDMDVNRRQQLERERADWLVLAERRRLWDELRLSAADTSTRR